MITLSNFVFARSVIYTRITSVSHLVAFNSASKYILLIPLLLGLSNRKREIRPNYYTTIGLFILTI